MNRRFVSSAIALVLSACFVGNVYAEAGPKGSTGATTVTVGTSTTKGKLISFHLRNDSGSALTLQIGDQQITVEAGKTAALKAAEGTQIVAVNSAGRTVAGSVVTTVNPMLNGNTIAVS